MHDASYRIMRNLRGCIPSGARVLDVGGANVNGTYRDLFRDCAYESLDYVDADIIVTGHEWPLGDEIYDAVISGQTLEHDRFFWLTVKNIARVLRPGGFAIIIVPSAGGIHRHPVDCYRFMPDSMKALADWAGLNLVRTEWDNESSWRDLAGVFQKPEHA